jgi:nucleoside-diphosphate-sugar epimerase/uncharacterized membrane protein
MSNREDLVIVTGGSGFIGRALMTKLSERYRVINLDRDPAPDSTPALFEPIDITSDHSVREALTRVRARFGDRVASVIHLAAYFDLTGEPNDKYEHITVRGTERLLRELKSFEVEQFIFASTMLVHAAGRPGERIDENRPLDPKFPYRASKEKTEQLLREQRGAIPVVLLRLAGVYDDDAHSTFLAHQIARIYQRSPQSRVYPADLRTGQSFLHLVDLVDGVGRLIERRKELPHELPLLLGEPDVMSYEELQHTIGRLLCGEEWRTWEIPKALAKAGAWVQDEVLGEESFIRPWMVDMADDHYALDISRAQQLLGWQPKHSLRTSLPHMIGALKADPVAWFKTNRLGTSKVIARAPEPQREAHAGHVGGTGQHAQHMEGMRMSTLWCHFAVIALGAWLLTSPWQFSLFDPAAAQLVRDISQERDLWTPAARNALTAWSDIASGVLLMIFGALALSKRHQWAQWGTTAVGLWLLFAPIIFWTPSAAAYLNDTAVGAFAIAFSVLVPMMPGMSHEGMADPGTVPAGWTYSPSTWAQRIPIIALGLFGFLISRYLTAYQLGHIDSVWEPFFTGQQGKNGTEYIITSDVSRAWPIADAGLGAISYMLEVLMGAMGTANRWRTMPWMVTFFFILVVPLGGVSIFFIIIQPIMIGTYCTLCLIAAAAMLIMIPLTVDELGAMTQYMRRSVRAGRPFIRTFLQGGPDLGDQEKGKTDAPKTLRGQLGAATWGVTLPWSLLATCAVGVILMFSRLLFGAEGSMANSDHLVGALLITVAGIAMAEVARPLRFLNVLLGLWLIGSPWLLADVTLGRGWYAIVAGVLTIGLSLPRGRRSEQHYGSWDSFVV